MSKLITINYLSHTRPDYADLTFHYLKKIKSENKSKIKLNILATVTADWAARCSDLDGIECDIYVNGNNNNYISKLNIALSSNSKYSVKLDEDCFINNHIWDYIIENINILDSNDNLLISPIMSNNIPSCDLFINDAIKDEAIKNAVYNEFLKRSMPNGLWGVNYESLNKFTVDADKWDYKSFYNAVGELPTQIKGIHPVRICGEAQLMINDYILENIDILNDKKEYSFIEFDAPYFTNSLFVIKTDIWLDIVNNKVDSFDEISLNNYKRNNNKKILFINNGFGTHLMFNTVYGNKNMWGIGIENGPVIERDFYHKLKNKII